VPFVKIWVHLVWTTKNRAPLLTKDIKMKVFKHILENSKLKGINIDFINGYNNHVHALLYMKSKQSISEIVHLVKGESSYWVNKNQLTKYKFGWQDEFYVVSVSSSDVDFVRDYIKNQEDHHNKISFNEECKILFNELEIIKPGG
jgi:REP element-mobilizing transposase RayT